MSPVIVALVAVLALVAAGCGDGDDADPEASANEPSTAAENDQSDADEDTADDSPADDGSESAGSEASEAEGQEADSDALVRSAGDGQPVDGFDYGSVDYSVPAVESALRGNRQHVSFPPPVIDPGTILSGGQPPDGIFPIDQPTFASPDELDYEIAETEAVIAVEVDGDARAFPVQIMIWHEIVNTEIGGTPVSVTFCPLCNSAVSFDRRFGDQVLDFGTSGELYQSALVMYDRQTESLWAHFTGESLVGHLAGARLDLVPTQTVSYGDWRAAHPDGLVLTRDLSAPPSYAGLYGSNPYGGYDTEGLDPFGQFFIGEIDRTLLAKARIVGIVDDVGPVAVRFDDLIEQPVIPVTEGGRNLVVFHKPGLASPLDRFAITEGRDVGQTGVFVPTASDGMGLTFTADGDGFRDEETGSSWNVLGQAVAGPLEGERLEPVAHTDAFWFAWATYQPGTVIVGQ